MKSHLDKTEHKLYFIAYCTYMYIYIYIYIICAPVHNRNNEFIL